MLATGSLGSNTRVTVLAVNSQDTHQEEYLGAGAEYLGALTSGTT